MVTEFKKSSFCGDSACVEVSFHKASGCDTGACVEVSLINGKDVVLVRSTTAPENVVTFTADEWSAFIDGAKAGEFDLDQV